MDAVEIDKASVTSQRWGGFLNCTLYHFLPSPHFLNSYTTSFKVGGEFWIDYSSENNCSYPESLLVYMGHYISLANKRIFPFSLKSLNMVLLSYRFLKSDSPDLKCTGFPDLG